MPVPAQCDGPFHPRSNEVQRAFETFAGFRFEAVKTTYTIAAKTARPKRAEVLFSNWPLTRL